MASLGFDFPIDESGQWDGFNDAGMEHFTGNPFQHLGREVPQNTIDARVKAPARLRIELHKVPVSKIPDVAGLRKAIDACIISSRTVGGKAEKWFLDAQKLLKKSELHVLQFIDSNTSGVKGPCENGKPFFDLLKATGQSTKAANKTGSFGIGKFAPFTVSALRTVFVSTVWLDDNGKAHHYVQGKAVLMSHKRDRKTHRGTGFWGIQGKCLPLDGSIEKLPNWLRRADSSSDLAAHVGTTLSIVGFEPKKNWQDVIAANVVENFFGAIRQGDLCVEIEGSHTIDAATLDQLVVNADLEKAIREDEGEPDKFKNVASYLSVLRSDDESVKVSETENTHLGLCELRVVVADQLPKKVAVLRNGMLITEAFPGLRRFGEFKDFAAVLQCKSPKGLELLRAMEPPRHDTFEPDRLGSERRTQGRAAIREIASWVRERLRLFAQDAVAEQTNLNELADFFADESDEGLIKRPDENPRGSIVIRAREMKPKLARAPSLFDGSADGRESGSLADISGDGPGTGSGTGGDGSKESNEGDGGDKAGREGGAAKENRGGSAGVPIKDVRAVPLSSIRRRVAFTPLESGSVEIELQDSGADSNYPLTVATTSIGQVRDGRVVGIVVAAGRREVLEVDLDTSFAGTLRVVVGAV